MVIRAKALFHKRTPHMPNGDNRLRLHPAAVLGLLLFVGGGAATLTLLSSEETEEITDVSSWDVWDAVDEVIASVLVSDSSNTIGLHGELVSLHPELDEFYRERNHLPAWSDEEARDTLTHTLRDLWTYGLNPDKYFATVLTDMVENTLPDPEGADTTLAELDLLLTHAAFSLADDLAKPNIDVHELFGVNWFSYERTHTFHEDLSDALDSSTIADSVALALESLHPSDSGFHDLRAAYVRHRNLLEMPEWPTILPGRTLAPGDTSVLVPILRKRMNLEGYALAESTSSDSLVYDELLVRAVASFQDSRGLEVDSLVSQPTRSALNTRPEDQSTLFQLNLEKWRWLPQDLGDFHVMANVPEFELTVRRKAGDRYNEELRMLTVVGKRGWETPVFSDTMTQVIFNPTWTIPRSIQIESYGEYRGLVVQQPGPYNPMRRVKFRFPNNMAIYIHDTTSQWSFSRDVRAYSHGCIRAAEPDRLAEAILAETNAWIPEQVQDIFSGPWVQQHVDIERPIPMHIVYFTAWADENGLVKTFDDVYGHDRVLAEAMGIEL